MEIERAPVWQFRQPTLFGAAGDSLVIDAHQSTTTLTNIFTAFLPVARYGRTKSIGATMKWAGLIFAALPYLVWPYYTLLELGHAVQNFDVMTVNRLVDWKQLRTNLKTQLTENIQTNSKRTALEGMETPGGVIRLMQSSAPLSQVAAFFVSPIRFRLDLTGAAQQSGTVTLFLEFKGTGWQLSDMRLPTAAAALGS